MDAWKDDLTDTPSNGSTQKPALAGTGTNTGEQPGFMAAAGLQRFVDAQAGVMETVLAELRAGRKRTPWMWFVFPQISGLGWSAMSQRYGIVDIAEALRAFFGGKADRLTQERL